MVPACPPLPVNAAKRIQSNGAKSLLQYGQGSRCSEIGIVKSSPDGSTGTSYLWKPHGEIIVLEAKSSHISEMRTKKRLQSPRIDSVLYQV